MSRFKRFRSARSSAALWQRSSRSFSRALFRMVSSWGGRPGFNWDDGVGTLFRIASKMTAEVVPEKRLSPGRHFIEHDAERE